MNEIEFQKYTQKGAYHWDEYFGGIRRMNAYTRARYDAVVECLRQSGMQSSQRVLDVGCGDGALSGLLTLRFGCQVTGLDASVLAIEYAKTKFSERGYRGDFRLIDGYRYDLDSESFDAAVCSDVIEHVRDPKAMLTEIHRVLKPAGVLVLTTPIRFTEKPLDPMHVREWFVEEFVSFCRQIFGEPEQVRITHPVIWYEAYTLNRPLAGRLARLGINTLAWLGLNPFLKLADGWRCYTTQLLVLRKSENGKI